ncbi:MAG: methyltransferase domain-containing protein [Candidatus Brocadiales bacterium]|nr:methyltransferase domain-containing protein [Candidatus Brocadiales bacterium]
MKDYILEYIKCPECNGSLIVSRVDKGSDGEIDEGQLKCEKCAHDYSVIDGIPVLLPAHISNADEHEIRKKVSDEAAQTVDNWRSQYDPHHFRELAHLRLHSYIEQLEIQNPRVLDIGVGWGVNYIPLLSDIELWGMDFSLESLMLLKKIYKQAGVRVPNLVCGSLGAIPLKNIQFNIISSTQVYQHIPEQKEIEKSFAAIIHELLDSPGIFIVDNFNYNYDKVTSHLKKIFRPDKYTDVDQVKNSRAFYYKFYLKKDFDILMEEIGGGIKYDVTYTENLFHPDMKLIPRGRVAAIIDAFVSRLPISKYTGRQISLSVSK